MNDITILLKRDLKNSFHKRLIIMLLFLLLFQFWFILGSDSIEQVRETGIMNYMAVVFSINFLGTIVASILNYDGISNERESKFLDLILTSGIEKNKVYISKILTSLLISGVFAFSYILFIMLIYFIFTGDIGMSLLTFRYILPLTGFLFLFSLLGLMFSVIFRSSRLSLIVSLTLGVLLIPRLFTMVVDSLSSLFGFNETVTQIIYLVSPALIMNALNGYSEIKQVACALLLLVFYLTVSIILGLYVFHRQDELNYGE